VYSAIFLATSLAVATAAWGLGCPLPAVFLLATPAAAVVCDWLLPW
jgi:hypothetical protein